MRGMVGFLVALVLGLSIPPPVTASEMWLLVQVNATGQVLASLGAFSSREACTNELARHRAKGLKGLECRALSTGSQSPPSAPPPAQSVSPRIYDDPLFGRLNVGMIDRRGCPARWSPATTAWVSLGDFECSGWRWLQANASTPGPYYLTARSGSETSRALLGVNCVWRDRNGLCRMYERVFLVTETDIYALYGTYETAVKCAAAWMARGGGGECAREYVPARSRQYTRRETVWP
jgi:hypothetical protein